MRYIDTNVFVRYLAADDPDKYEAATALFERVASGEERVAVLEATVGEVVYVLGSKNLYAMRRREIVERLSAMLNHSGISMSNKRRCLNALDLYATYSVLNFGDSIIGAAALEEDTAEVYSFGRGFDRVPGITRVEPATA